MIEETMNLIKSRRSVRSYEPTPVDHASLTILLEAAMYAPSAHNGRPWHFIACDDPDVIAGLRKAHPYGTALETAPLCIAVLCTRPPSDVPDLSQQDGAAATQNILLAAAAMDLGTCWLGVAPRKELEEPIAALLEIPASLYPFSLIAVGHPTEHRPMPLRYASETVHINKW